MHGSHRDFRIIFSAQEHEQRTYHTSRTPQINTVVKAIGENQLRDPQLPWLSKYLRLISLNECLSEVKNPNIFFIFIYPGFPLC